MNSAKYRADGPADPEQEPGMDAGGADATGGGAGAADASGEGAGPEIGALTANNLARHMAYLRQSQSDDGATLAPAGEVKTLGTDDPELAARRAAYLQRRGSKRENRKQRGGMLGSPKGAAGVDSNCFLSNVPEVEADVEYRFNFVVVGAGKLAEQVVELACESEAAHKLPSGRDGAQRPETPSRANARAPKAQRCLCAVQDPGAGKGGADLQKLTKLVFTSVAFGRQLPACCSRLEALGTALVFVLTIDGEGAPGTFEQQLQSLAEAVEGQRTQTRAKFRPVRAVVLCSHADPAAAAGQEAWAAALSDFEQAHGDMWKFGPLAAADGDALHAVFAEMAGVRILQGHGGRGPELPPGAVPAEEPQEEQEGENEGEEERALLEQQLRERAAGGGARRRASSESPSEASEGWQRPPVFEAEFDGSQCSEDILERHAQAHGLDPASVPRPPPAQPPPAWGAEADVAAEGSCHPDACTSPKGQSCAIA